MKKILMFLSAIFICAVAFAHTINWHVDDQIISTTTCSSGDSITPPTAPVKYGYHFKKWSSRYTQLEYIESTGTQWIDTEYIPNINTKIRVKTQKTEMYVYSGNVAGCQISSASINNIAVAFYTNDLRYVYSDFGNYGAYRALYKYQGDPIFVLEASKNSRRIYEENGINILATSTSGVSGDFSVPKSIWLFDINGANDERLRGRIYYAKIYDNDILVRDFIPVKRVDGTIGMYDTVTNTFFTNSGTGKFIAGPEVGAL